MKKTILIITLFISSLSYSQYCAFFDFKTDEPEMVVSSLKGMMQTDWAKTFKAQNPYLLINLTEQTEQHIPFNFVFLMKLHLQVLVLHGTVL
jgi:hypothetical protein